MQVTLTSHGQAGCSGRRCFPPIWCCVTPIAVSPGKDSWGESCFLRPLWSEANVHLDEGLLVPAPQCWWRPFGPSALGWVLSAGRGAALCSLPSSLHCAGGCPESPNSHQRKSCLAPGLMLNILLPSLSFFSENSCTARMISFPRVSFQWTPWILHSLPFFYDTCYSF